MFRLCFINIFSNLSYDDHNNKNNKSNNNEYGETFMSNKQLIDEILTNSRVMAEKSNYEKGIFWIINGLGHYPGEMSLLLEAKNIITSLTKDDKSEETEQRLAWLGSVFQEQVKKVKTEDLPQLLDWLDELNEEFISLTTIVSVDEQSQSVKIEDQANTLLNEVERDSFSFSKIPFNIDELELENEFEKLSKLADQIEAFELNPQKADTLSKVKDHLIALGTARRYKAIQNEVEKVFQCIEHSLTKPEAVYLIQHIDGLLRQLVVLATSLDEQWLIKTSAIIDQLRKLDNKREQETVSIPQKAELDNFSLKINQEISNIVRRMDRNQVKLKQYGTLIKEIQNFKIQNSWCLNESKIKQIEDDIQNEVREISIKQHQKYNQWAIKEIRIALKLGIESMGFRTNRRKIGQAMVNHLGLIDTRYLTMEVNRMYSEVFEYLYKELKKPKRADDIDDQSNTRRLGVLNKMYNKTNRNITEF